MEAAHQAGGSYLSDGSSLGVVRSRRATLNNNLVGIHPCLNVALFLESSCLRSVLAHNAQAFNSSPVLWSMSQDQDGFGVSGRRTESERGLSERVRFHNVCTVAVRPAAQLS